MGEIPITSRFNPQELGYTDGTEGKLAALPGVLG
jgi:hypothetical protein